MGGEWGGGVGMATSRLQILDGIYVATLVIRCVLTNQGKQITNEIEASWA